FSLSDQCTFLARGILHFPIGGPFLRVRFSISLSVDHSCAWVSAFPERWTIPERGILRFPSGGRLPRVDSAFPERWSPPARGILHFPSGGPSLRVGFCIS